MSEFSGEFWREFADMLETANGNREEGLLNYADVLSEVMMDRQVKIKDINPNHYSLIISSYKRGKVKLIMEDGNSWVVAKGDDFNSAFGRSIRK